jgi:hypothetical protein
MRTLLTLAILSSGLPGHSIRLTKAQESRLPLVRVEEDGIIAHGVVRSKLVVELDFEIKCVWRVKVYGCNSTSIETVVNEAWPPAVQDVQAEAY